MNIVYWAVFDKGLSIVNNKDPVNVFNKTKNIYPKILSKEANFIACPAYYQEASKIFNLLAPFRYSLEFKEGHVITKNYDQNTFDKYVTASNADIKFIQLKYDYVFFTEKPCLMTASAPYFSSSELSIRANYIPGSFDISKWFRNLNIPIILKPAFDSLSIEEGDEILSVKFDFQNNQKIILKKFYISPTLEHVYETNMKSRMFFNKNLDSYLSNIYEKFTMSKTRNLVLKEIKSNLLE